MTIEYSPRSDAEVYKFLGNARTHLIVSARDSSYTSHLFDAIRILQGAMTSVMIGSERIIY